MGSINTAIANTEFRLFTFGRLELTDGTPEPGAPLLTRGKPLALLVYCTAERGRAHTRDALGTLLWADSPPERARHSLRQALWRLRRALGALLITSDDVVLGVDRAVMTDRDLFLEAVAQDDHAAAIELYRGPFLDGLSLPGADEFEDWAAAERARLEGAFVRVIERAARAEPPRLKVSELRATVERLLTCAPDSIEARRLAMELLLDLGDRVEARREADALEALAVRLGRSLTAPIMVVIAKARTADDEVADHDDDDVQLEMVGRDEPFARAMTAWAHARRGDPQYLLFNGVAGVGKTRLLQSVVERCGRRSGRMLMVRAHAGEQTLSWSFLTSLVRVLCAQPGAAGVSSESAIELVRLDPGLAAQFHVPASSGVAEGDDGTRRRALALLDLLQAIAEQHPLGLVLDDLHWIDDASSRALIFALARTSDMALFVLGAARPGVSALDHPALERLDLAPLDNEAVLGAIRGSGTWPAGPQVEQFLTALAAACEGIPLHVVERLTLALETGLLEKRLHEWSSPDWAAATREIALSSPMSRRLRSCNDAEREALLALTVAGTPLTQELFGSAENVQPTLRQLEAKGFVRQAQGVWMPVHDTIVEQLRADSSAAALQRAHIALADALMRSRLTDRLTLAVRHFHLGGDDSGAGAAFAKFVAQVRARGDGRRTGDLLRDMAGVLPADSARRILAGVPWFHRIDRLGTRAIIAATALFAFTTAALAWRIRSAPAVLIEQASISATNAPLFGDEAMRLVPAPVVRVASDESDRAPLVVRVRIPDGNGRIIAGDSVRVDSGMARFGGLRLATEDTVLRLQFEADGFRPVTMRVRVDDYVRATEQDGSLHLIEGRFIAAGRTQVVRGDSARLVVPPNTALDGVIQMEYSAPWPAASVWVAMTPTWGDPRTSGGELLPLTTPVRWDVVDLPVKVETPAVPGRYWLLFVANAEPSGGFLLSGTNWTMGEPLWGDGNDVATLPDSIIMAARKNGLAPLEIAFPPTRRTECPKVGEGSRALRYCVFDRGLLAIEVVVR